MPCPLPDGVMPRMIPEAGTWIDIAIARLRSNLECERISRQRWKPGSRACAGLRGWFGLDDHRRPRAARDGLRPDPMHRTGTTILLPDRGTRELPQEPQRTIQ